MAAAGSPKDAKKKEKVVEEASLERFCVPSIGKQYQSKRSNAPHYSISKCTRQHREKVFISKEASNACLNADTPGAIYDGAAASTLNLASGQKFSAGPKMVFGRWKNKYDWENKTEDKLAGDLTERANKNRYRKQAGVIFTTEPIGKLKNVEIFKAHPIAFQGLDSPGPLAYAKPNIDRTSKYNSFPSMPFGVKTDVGSMYKMGKSATEKIGPFTYPPETSLGKQTNSKRRNPTTHSFPNAPKFGRVIKNADECEPLKMNLSSFGRQAKGGKRTETRVGFSQGTRGSAQRMTRCMSALDSAKPLGKVQLPHPGLPMESKTISYSGSMGCFS